MTLWLNLLLAAVVLMVFCAAAVITIGSAKWDRSTERLIQRLNRDRPSTSGLVFTPQELEGLPEPAARYFKFAIREGQKLIRTVRLSHAGEFRTGQGENDWKPFQSTQHFAVAPAGFVWDARIQMAPLMTVRVRDGYVGGEGSIKAKVLGVFSVMEEQNRPELNSGALQRYLAEAVWFPTALLPSQGVRWTAVDDSTALASLTDSGVTVTLKFHFNEEGEVLRVFTPERYRQVDGSYLPTPWTGSFRNYEERGGFRVPTEGQVEWIMDGKSFPYWRGRLAGIEYDPAP